MMDETNWYVIKAIYGRAMYAKNQLSKQSIESYVPMEANIIYVGKKKTTKLTPVFNNLIFINTDEQTINNLVRDNDYLHYVYNKVDNKHVPSIVAAQEMNSFISFVESRESELIRVSLEDIDLTVGERVRVTHGSFMGREAVLARVKGKRSKQVVITLGSHLAMRIEIDPIYLERITD